MSSLPKSFLRLSYGERSGQAAWDQDHGYSDPGHNLHLRFFDFFSIQHFVKRLFNGASYYFSQVILNLAFMNFHEFFGLNYRENHRTRTIRQRTDRACMVLHEMAVMQGMIDQMGFEFF